ncbi:MAG: hypothetical protein MJA29_12965 [Candidatus Omnitrophica bacterium]|nr:hypothetical protein [Candidatus Omnitrophota bacterium]
MQNKKQIIAVTLACVALLIVGFLVFPSFVPKSDTGFARHVVKGLVSGKVETRKFVDWERANFFGYDVGAQYRQQEDKNARWTYTHAFIRNLAVSFRQQGGSAGDFIKWRIHMRADEETVVAADYPKKNQVLLVHLGRASGKRKLRAVAWEPKVESDAE